MFRFYHNISIRVKLGVLFALIFLILIGSCFFLFFNRPSIKHLDVLIYFFSGVSAIFFFIIVIAYNHYVIRPLRKIIFSLNHHSSEKIIRLANRGNEFGKISKLIIDFFEQKQLLEAKIDDLNKTKEDLINLSFELLSQKEESETLTETLIKANDEISAKNAEIEWHRDELEIQHSELTESISYASIIQRAVLEIPRSFCSDFPDHFFLLLPRNILSGDFYWIREHEGKYYVAGADCTGHSLAGALLSMMGVSYLNEILLSNVNVSAADMLNKLRNFMVDALHQSGEFGEAHGGMDVALCIIDPKKTKLEFAGAFNSLYISKINKSTGKRELIEYKGDKMPVGIYVRESPFQNHIIHLEAGDEIFLASDGIADQFGGINNKKFNSKNFRNLLLEASQHPIHKQKQFVIEEYNKWRGDNDQTDDVMLLGIVCNHA